MRRPRSTPASMHPDSRDRIRLARGSCGPRALRRHSLRLARGEGSLDARHSGIGVCAAVFEPEFELLHAARSTYLSPIRVGKGYAGQRLFASYRDVRRSKHFIRSPRRRAIAEIHLSSTIWGDGVPRSCQRATAGTSVEVRARRFLISVTAQCLRGRPRSSHAQRSAARRAIGAATLPSACRGAGSPIQPRPNRAAALLVQLGQAKADKHQHEQEIHHRKLLATSRSS